jgi:DNA polymerase-3 subunit alpha
MSLFIPLRIYSDYSFGQSNLKLKQIIMGALDRGMPALALTDRNLFGALEFAIGAAASGLQPIIGYSCDLEVKIGKKNLLGEVLLLVKSEKGYSNLLKLATRVGVDRQVLERPSLDWDFLVNYSEGLIILLSNLDDTKLLNQVFLVKEEKALLEIIRKQSQLEIFLEMNRYPDGSHKKSEGKLLELAYQEQVPLVATSPVAFLNPDSYESAEALVCIINNRFLGEDNRPKINPNHYFKSQDQVIELFSDLPEAINNTVLIAQKCHFFPTKTPITIPKFDPNSDAREILEREAWQGLDERLLGLKLEKAIYDARLRFELDLIQKMNFSDYFLIVSDFIKWSKSQGIAVGPGRGSGAGSIVAWCLKITELDPIAFGLLFERFLNPERISLPDFDIDFCQQRRDEVLGYIRKKYGEDKIAHIITFGKLQPRAVLRDVGRVLQIPYPLVDRISKMIPQNQANPVTLQQAINLDRELQRMRDEDHLVERLLRLALQIEGCHRNISTHAAGVVIADRPLVEVLPLYKDPDSGILSGQFSMKYVEAAGLIKFDFLGLKTLTVISNTQKLLKKSQGIDLDLYKIPVDDKKTYKMLSEGKVLGVFQLEGSAGIREAVKQMQPDELNDITALTSLYRPGPMENIPTYVARKHGKERVEVIHPDLKELLDETYGIIVYQEQVIKIAQILAGYSLGAADVLRRAMGKKDKDEMAQQRAIFVSKSVERGLPESQAEEIFDLVNKFASYGFNKSHGAAYALVSYQTAYLKANYLAEFLVSSMNLELHLQEKINAFCDEAKANGLEILKPDINNSRIYFTLESFDQEEKKLGFIESNLQEMKIISNLKETEISKVKIGYGLGAIKGTGLKTLTEIIDERDRFGPFKSLEDFLTRTAAKGFNKRLFEQLVRAGALESLYNNGKELLLNIDKINHFVSDLAKNKGQNQGSLLEFFSDETEKPMENLNLTKVVAWSKMDKLQAEYKALGFYLTEHPVQAYLNILKKEGIYLSYEINDYKEQEPLEIALAGVVQECKIRSGKGEKAGKYAFVTLSDPYGNIDLSVFDSNILVKDIKLLDKGSLVFCRATIKNDPQGQRVLLRSIKPFLTALEEFIPSFTLKIKNLEAAEAFKKLLDLELKKEDRGLKVNLLVITADGSKVYLKSNENLYLSHEFLLEVKKVPGLEIVN